MTASYRVTAGSPSADGFPATARSVCVWAAATNITRNGANPNFVFRVSAVDVLVDRALIKYAMTKFGSKKPGLMLVNNGWGESNFAGLTAAADTAASASSMLRGDAVNSCSPSPESR